MNKFENTYVDRTLLGEDSYSAVVYNIHQAIMNAKAETIEGSEFLSKMYDTLNESSTPVLSLKPFITKGEELAQNDNTVGKIMKIIKKSINGNADLNFIINLCKEEHFDNMNRAGLPSPESTIKSFEDAFNKNSSQTEKLIKEGIFDGLKSNLLGQIKKDLGYSENEATTSEKNNIVDLDESSNFGYTTGNIYKYSPVGFIVKSSDGRNYAFTEGRCIKLNENQQLVEDMEIVPVEEVDTITTAHSKLMRAIEDTTWNPETNEFSTSQIWDIDLRISPEGKILLSTEDGDREIALSDLQDLLIESLNLYERRPESNPEYTQELRQEYIKDADNFIALATNFDKLVKFDNITVVKKTDENGDTHQSTTIMFDNRDLHKPEVLVNGLNENQKFNSFKELCESCDNTIGNQGLFRTLLDKNLNEESDLMDIKFKRLSKLNEDQDSINRDLQTISEMKTVAEQNSPVMDELNQREEKLQEILKKNIDEVTELKQSQLY